MIVRIRQPSGIRRDIDLGPSAARMKAQTYSVSAATVPNMTPVLSSGVYLENRGRRKPPQAFSIHPENRRPDPFARLTRRQLYVLRVVEAHNGNRSRAARELGINRATVQASMRLCAKAGASIPPIARRGTDLISRTRRGSKP